MTQRILIPLDGSPRSLAIVPQVRRLLGRPGAEVKLLRVVERGPSGPLDCQASFDLTAQFIVKYIARSASERLTGYGEQTSRGMITSAPKFL